MWKFPLMGGQPERAKKEERVYLDYAGSMPVAPVALEACIEASRSFGNPGALHAEAISAKRSLDGSRRTIASELGVKAHEIIFTSGGTEGNNLAILGAFKERMLAGRGAGETHWIVSAIEHPSVLECFAHIEQMGGAVTYLSPRPDGRIDPDALAHALSPETVLVSIGWANGEIGTVQPLSAIARVLRAYEEAHHTRILFHADAGQGPLYISPQPHTLGVDLFTLDGGKLGSPRGIGALFVREGVRVSPLFYGGSQESGLRPGTENVALAAGAAAALGAAAAARTSEPARLAGLREALCGSINAEPALAGTIANGTAKHCLPHLLNISIPDIDNEYLTLALDRAGFAIATKSACREGEKASHVIAAIAPAPDAAWRATNALRISMGEATTGEAVSRFVRALCEAVTAFRAHQ